MVTKDPLMSYDSRVGQSDGLVPRAPCAPVKSRELRLHGIMIEDPYAWMGDEDDPDTEKYLAAENAYARTATQHLSPLQAQLFEEFKGRIAEEDCDVPERVDDFYYYSRSLAGREYPVHCRRKAGTDKEVAFLDENELASDTEYFELGAYAICPNHRLVAYVVDMVGDESYTLFIRDIESGELIDGPVTGVSEEICWSEDATGIFFLRIDDNCRPYAAILHVLGSESIGDRVLYTEVNQAFFLSLWKSRSRSYVFIEAHSNTTSEVHFIDAYGNEAVQCFRRRQTGIEYSIDHRPGEFLVLTNKDAPNFRLLSVPENGIDMEERFWCELLPNREQVTLERVDVYAAHIVLCERCSGMPIVRIMDTSGSIRTLELPEQVCELEVEDLEDFHSPEIWVGLSAPTTPDTIYAYPLAGGERRVLKAHEAEGFDPLDYSTERCWVPGQDGVAIPLTLVRKKTMVGGPAPLLLRGYGAYEESYEVYFDSDLISLLDRGIVVAIAHVRGGGELGRYWYLSGKMMHKENSFSDFISCAEYLIDQGYTGRGQIALHGASAGGLLVAVAMQRCPELFAAVVAEVPFVDVLNTLLDEDAPLTKHDREEFGDPADKQTFHYLRNYSPYENVRTGPYPPLLVTAALEDYRVGYWEPLKWVARLRAAKTDHNLLILKVEEAGHHGESGRYQELKHSASICAFLMDCWGFTASVSN